MTYPNDPGSYGYPPVGPRRRPYRRHAISHGTVAILTAVAAVLITLQVSHSGTGISNVPGGGAVPAPGPSSAPAGSAGTAAVRQAVNRVGPGVVLINSTLQYSSEAAAGTGMVINADGLVLTNNHVIAGSTKLTAKVTATGQTYPATVVGYDKTGDVALLRLQGASGLKTVPLGNSTTVRTGTAVVALGNAQGQGAVVPATGQVTGLNRTITASDQGGTASSETLHGMIQTNADIQPGDSGGPLSNSASQVIGMDTAAQSVSSGEQQRSAAGFAIPINTALSVARQIAAGQASSTIAIGYPPFVGILIGSSTSSNPQTQAQQQEQQNGFGDGTGGFGGYNGFGGSGSTPHCYTSNTGLTVPSTIAPASSGTLIDGVICGSPAATAGITAGSVITAVNGQQAGAPSHLTGILAQFRPGQTISVTWVSPSGKQSTSQLRLAQGPPQ
ncbi:MAG TPA: trypsin-like peptidase domain-containing protein [Streptosporangiaceae bacterium]